MSQLTMGSLYSGGIDAFSYAGEKLGIKTLWQVEKNYDLFKFLKKNYPDAKRYFNDDQVGKRNLEWVDIICGGDPCQPHSAAGNGLGTADYRYRWPQMFRIISELRPNWVVNENVTGSVSNMVLDQKISDLEAIGYSCQAYNIPACAVGAHHERQRIFLVAHAESKRYGFLPSNEPCCPMENIKPDEGTLDAQGNSFLQFEKRFGEPAIFPIPYGIPDHILRLGAAGNAIVSPIPMILLSCILEIEKLLNE